MRRRRIRSIMARCAISTSPGPIRKAAPGSSGKGSTHLIKVAVETAVGMRDQVAVYGTDYPTPDGTCIRDYIHVSDLAAAHVAALEWLIAAAGRESHDQLRLRPRPVGAGGARCCRPADQQADQTGDGRPPAGDPPSWSRPTAHPRNARLAAAISCRYRPHRRRRARPGSASCGARRRLSRFFTAASAMRRMHADLSGHSSSRSASLRRWWAIVGLRSGLRSSRMSCIVNSGEDAD